MLLNKLKDSDLITAESGFKRFSTARTYDERSVYLIEGTCIGRYDYWTFFKQHDSEIQAEIISGSEIGRYLEPLMSEAKELLSIADSVSEVSDNIHRHLFDILDSDDSQRKSPHGIFVEKLLKTYNISLDGRSGYYTDTVLDACMEHFFPGRGQYEADIETIFPSSLLEVRSHIFNKYNGSPIFELIENMEIEICDVVETIAFHDESISAYESIIKTLEIDISTWKPSVLNKSFT